MSLFMLDRLRGQNLSQAGFVAASFRELQRPTSETGKVSLLAIDQSPLIILPPNEDYQ